MRRERGRVFGARVGRRVVDRERLSWRRRRVARGGARHGDLTQLAGISIRFFVTRGTLHVRFGLGGEFQHTRRQV